MRYDCNKQYCFAGFMYLLLFLEGRLIFKNYMVFSTYPLNFKAIECVMNEICAFRFVKSVWTRWLKMPSRDTASLRRPKRKAG